MALNQNRIFSLLAVLLALATCGGLWAFAHHLTSPGVRDTFGRLSAAEDLLRDDHFHGMSRADLTRTLGQPDAKEDADRVWEWNIAAEFTEARIAYLRQLQISFDKDGRATSAQTRLQQ